ncbi:MAG: D-cysteine desulfhydrase family protein [Rhodobiaceae bacterium]|nr:D-cysteine desulfhydrase family protein [Rhodobiaceae bacterium]
MTLDEIPRLNLGFLPTPVENLHRLSTAIGVNFALKRDDFTGFGGGGNKVRKLEFLMAEAVEKGAKVVITTGGHQSNHARMTAAAARKFGMKPILVLRGHRPAAWQGNLLLDHLLGATVDFLDPDAYFDEIAPRMQFHAEEAEKRGEPAYIIPLGGASALGAMGYVSAIRELARQYEVTARRPPDYVAAPVGSGGTLAGMLVGCSMYWPQTKPIGIAVSGSAVPFPERIAVMADAAAKLLGLPHRFSASDIQVETDYVGEAYAIPSEDGNAAIKLLGRAEGVFLDPVYTGKAVGGLLDLIRRGEIEPKSDLLFIHCGGSPALFPFSDLLTRDLPPE